MMRTSTQMRDLVGGKVTVEWLMGRYLDCHRKRYILYRVGLSFITGCQ
jgi:hypothetical protein